MLSLIKDSVTFILKILWLTAREIIQLVLFMEEVQRYFGLEIRTELHFSWRCSLKPQLIWCYSRKCNHLIWGRCSAPSKHESIIVVMGPHYTVLALHKSSSAYSVHKIASNHQGCRNLPATGAIAGYFNHCFGTFANNLQLKREYLRVAQCLLCDILLDT